MENKLTEKGLFDKLVVIFGEISMLSEDVKELKELAKEDGLDKERISYISKVAKAKADCKIESNLESAKKLIETVEEFV